MSAYLTVGVLLIVGIALLAGAGALSHLLGPSRVPGSEGFPTYESGVEPVGEGWSQSQIRYYVYAFLRGFRRRSGLRLSVGHDLRRPGVRHDGVGRDGRVRRPPRAGLALRLAQARSHLDLTRQGRWPSD